MCEQAGGEAGPSWPWPHSLMPAFPVPCLLPSRARMGKLVLERPLLSEQHTRQGLQRQPRSQFRSATLAA